MGKLVMTLGAMATEHVFYGENSVGVGGDVHSASTRALVMVGASAMGPQPIDLDGRFDNEEDEEAERERLERRFERIGNTIIHRRTRAPAAPTPRASPA